MAILALKHPRPQAAPKYPLTLSSRRTLEDIEADARAEQLARVLLEFLRRAPAEGRA
ncbi:MAG TPA: hypothetical protein VLV25_12960 [Steroidobacteraceae bacterium]|nr:hypothetical protein [Steroidobacteraceae bacterium]